MERRPFDEAILEPQNGYVRRSLYSRTLFAIDEVFDRQQLLVVLTERMDDDDTWSRRSNTPPSGGTAPHRDTQRHSRQGWLYPALHKLWELGLLDRAKKAPKPVRKVARKVLMRRGPRYDAMLAESLNPVPASVVVTLAADAERFTGGQ